MINSKVTSYLCIITFFIFIFVFKLVWGVVAGIGIYLLLNSFNKIVLKYTHQTNASKITLLSLFLIASFLIAVILYYLMYFSHNLVVNFNGIIGDSLTIIQHSKKYIPDQYIDYLPESFDDIKNNLLNIAHNNSKDMILATSHLFKSGVHIVIGLIVGSIIAFSGFSRNTPYPQIGIFAEELLSRIKNFVLIFNDILIAQIKISTINTLLTSIFLLLIVPIFGHSFPYLATVLFFTFVLGLIPVVGNLLSNFLIVVLSLSLSFEISLLSLLFLISIHKLEYFFNAKIVGDKINTKIWEILIAMIVFETLFGITGVALAPIFYGYIKKELSDNNLI